MATVTLATEAMGCRFELVLHGPDTVFLQGVGEEAIETIRELHQKLSAFAKDSVVSRINAAAGKQPVQVDAQTFEVLQIAEQIREESGGVFDATIGRLMERHGYRRSVVSGADTDASVSGMLLDAERRCVMLLDGRGAVDLGGIAKGFAIDQVLEEFEDAGVTDAFVHAGTSSVGSIGLGPDGQPWRVLVEGARGSIEMPAEGGALSVSSQSVQGTHAVDPRTGDVPTRMRQFCVLGRSAVVCDAWSTAAMVLDESPAGLPVGYECEIFRCVNTEQAAHV